MIHSTDRQFSKRRYVKVLSIILRQGLGACEAPSCYSIWSSEPAVCSKTTSGLTTNRFCHRHDAGKQTSCLGSSSYVPTTGAEDNVCISPMAAIAIEQRGTQLLDSQLSS